MSFQGRISRIGGTKVKRALGVQAALEWAFRVERAQLELPSPPDVTEEGFGFGLEYVLLQRAALGCKVDGGQHKMGSYTHPDAEVIAAAVAGIPDRLGGKRMAIRVGWTVPCTVADDGELIAGHGRVLAATMLG